MQLKKQIAVLQNPPISPTPTADPTENWKTYIFSYAPLSFRYPSQLSLEEENSTYPSQFRGVILKRNESSLKIHPLQGPFGYENSDKFPETIVINDQTIKKDRMVNISDGSQSYMVIIPYPNESQGNASVVIQYEFNDGKINKTDTKLFDQILSTFKFLK